ncbi:MAG: hypothetical protein IJH50_11610 [Kiritimatiellae bacterium]|nr:hypothetical protein [Kiritimatiellia bacterium]
MNAKRIVVAAAALAAGALFAEGLTLVAAREKIVEAISSPAVMTATVSQLSADDQRQFLADVNAAIGNMPGSQEELAASYLNACRAALKGAQKGNLATMIAEVFATVPVEYLPVISESLGSDMLNRAANPSTTYSDEEYLDIATNVMAKVNSRVEVEDNAGVRSGFAALAFIRGSNSGSEAIVSAMTAALPASVQEAAAKEWFPAALATGDAKSYDPMLVTASAETLPELESILDNMLLNVDGAQNQEALLADLGGANTDPSVSSQERTPIIDAIYNPLNESLPNLGTGSAFDTFTEGVIVPRGTGRKVAPVQVPQKPSEPIHGYGWQSRR